MNILAERLFAALLIVAATVLAALGKMTVDNWQTFAQVIFATYIAGKTVTSGVALLKGHAPQDGAATLRALLSAQRAAAAAVAADAAEKDKASKVAEAPVTVTPTVPPAATPPAAA